MCHLVVYVCLYFKGFQFAQEKKREQEHSNMIIDLFIKLMLNFYSHKSFFIFVLERASSSMLANLFGKSVLSCCA